MQRENKNENYTVKEATTNGFEQGLSLFKTQKAAFSYAAYLMRQGKAVTIRPPKKREA